MIKTITIQDLDQLVDVAQNAFRSTYPSLFTETQFKDFFKQFFSKTVFQKEMEKGSISYIGFYEKEQLVAFMTLEKGQYPSGKVETTIDFENTIYIDKLYILSLAQGKGIGRQLIQYAVDFAKDQHLNQIWLAVWSGNKNAQLFYQKLGFQKIGEQRFIFDSINELDYILLLNLE